MFLVEEEGTASSFRGLAEVAATKGLFCALYTDRASHYFPYAGGWRQGVADAADAGRPGAFTARHRAHRRLFAGGARPLRPHNAALCPKNRVQYTVSHRR